MKLIMQIFPYFLIISQHIEENYNGPSHGDSDVTDVTVWNRCVTVKVIHLHV